MKKSTKKILCLILCFVFCINSLGVNATNTENSNLTSDEFLIEIGMSHERVDKLDSDIKEFIVEDLKKRVGDDISDLQNVETQDEPMILPRGLDNLTGIRFDVIAVKAGGIIHIYPTYEFTDKKQPKGEDCFSFQLGNAMQAYEFGGKLWVIDERFSSDWIEGNTLSPTRVELNGAMYSGDQLGDLIYPMRVKGCMYCHAYEASGTEKVIAMNYFYNPNKVSYSVSFSYKNIGISISPSATAYSTGKLMSLSY